MILVIKIIFIAVYVITSTSPVSLMLETDKKMIGFPEKY
jgi:hypothetical protein